MTREHAKKILTHLRNGKSDLMLMDALDMAISVLSTEGEYIKKEDLFNKTIKRNSIWNGTTNAEGKGLEEIVNDLPTYSFPDSADIEKARAEIDRLPDLNPDYPMDKTIHISKWNVMQILDNIGKGSKE